MVKIYGIKNCDTMKKAFKWMDEKNITYDFHDYKNLGADKGILKAAIDAHSWENVLNKRGTTWRKLDDTIKENMSAESAIKVALDNPSIIKRPLIIAGDTILLGFNTDQCTEALK